MVKNDKPFCELANTSIKPTENREFRRKRERDLRKLRKKGLTKKVPIM